MRRLQIACDADGVLLRTEDAVCLSVNAKRGTSLTHKDVDFYGWWQSSPYRDDFWAAYDALDASPFARMLVQPYDEHAVPVLFSLMRDHGVTILTANDAPAAAGFDLWLRARAQGQECPKMRCLGRGPAQRKAAWPFDLFIDDSTNLAEEIDRGGRERGQRLLLANTHANRNYADSGVVKRFRSWAEVPELVKQVAEGEPW